MKREFLVFEIAKRVGKLKPYQRNGGADDLERIVQNYDRRIKRATYKLTFDEKALILKDELRLAGYLFRMS